jgi:hypothetical protein
MEELEALVKLVAAKAQGNGKFYWPSDLLEPDPGMEQLVRKGFAQKVPVNSVTQKERRIVVHEACFAYEVTSKGTEVYKTILHIPN